MDCRHGCKSVGSATYINLFGNNAFILLFLYIVKFDTNSWSQHSFLNISLVHSTQRIIRSEKFHLAFNEQSNIKFKCNILIYTRVSETLTFSRNKVIVLTSIVLKKIRKKIRKTILHCSEIMRFNVEPRPLAN